MMHDSFVALARDGASAQNIIQERTDFFGASGSAKTDDQNRVAAARLVHLSLRLSSWTASTSAIT